MSAFFGLCAWLIASWPPFILPSYNCVWDTCRICYWWWPPSTTIFTAWMLLSQEWPETVAHVCRGWEINSQLSSELQNQDCFTFSYSPVSFQVNQSWANTFSLPSLFIYIYIKKTCSPFAYFWGISGPFYEFSFGGSCCLLPPSVFNAVNTPPAHISFMCITWIINQFFCSTEKQSLHFVNRALQNHEGAWFNS